MFCQEEIKKKWWLRCRQVLADNTVYAPRGLICNFGHNHFIIERNQFTFALPYGEFYGMRHVSGIVLTNKGSGYTSVPTVKFVGGGEEAFGAEAEAIVKNGEVVEIKLGRVGSRYSEIPTVVIEGGDGTGATATATINIQTSGMIVGSEPRYGTMLGTQIRENYVQNSPDGNFARQIIFGKLKASSIVGNHCDVTPYSTPAKVGGEVGQPFVSDTIKHRDGLPSTSFVNGDFDNCYISENFVDHQLTDVSGIWTGKTANGDINKNYVAQSYAEQILLDKIKELSDKVEALTSKEQ